MSNSFRTIKSMQWSNYFSIIKSMQSHLIIFLQTIYSLFSTHKIKADSSNYFSTIKSMHSNELKSMQSNKKYILTIKTMKSFQNYFRTIKSMLRCQIICDRKSTRLSKGKQIISEHKIFQNENVYAVGHNLKQTSKICIYK